MTPVFMCDERSKGHLLLLSLYTPLYYNKNEVTIDASH